jgi:hypothetical protein
MMQRSKEECVVKAESRLQCMVCQIYTKAIAILSEVAQEQEQVNTRAVLVHFFDS